jgi:hypothetical protein
MISARSRRFLTGFVAVMAVWPALTAAAQPEPGAPARAAYERALKREEELGRLSTSAWQVYSRASAAHDAAHKHAEALNRLQQSVQARGEAFSRAIKAAGQFEENGRAVLAAVTAYERASDQALQAVTAFADARGNQRARYARAADAAMEAKAQALQRAQDAVLAADRAGDSLRNGLSNIAYRSRQVSEELSKVRATAEVLAAKSGEFGDATTKAGTGVVPVELAAASAQLTERGVRLREEAAALAGSLKLTRDLSDEMKLAQYQQPKELIRGYFEATLGATIEGDARSYAAAVQQVSAERCKAGSDCRSRLAAELAEADALHAAAKREAEKLAHAVPGVLDNAASVGRRVEEYAGVASGDLQTLAAAAASAAATGTLAEQARETAYGGYRRAAKAYEEAQQAADAAYLAAYGEPRHAREAEAAMAAQAPRAAYESAAKMAAPRWEVETHAWEFFTASAAESKGYGAYTYVLFGWRLGGRLSPQVKERYAALLDAVIVTTKHRTEVSPAIPPAKQNLFCIPGRTPWEEGLEALDEPGDKFPALDNYASSLALSILSGAGSGAVRSPEILGVIQDSPGPFLLTTLQPIRQARSGSPMLFVDLSRFQAATYADILTAYKRALVAGPPQGQQTWQPPAFQWVAATGTGVAGHLVKVKNAVSGWLSFGADKPAKLAVH